MTGSVFDDDPRCYYCKGDPCVCETAECSSCDEGNYKRDLDTDGVCETCKAVRKADQEAASATRSRLICEAAVAIAPTHSAFDSATDLTKRESIVYIVDAATALVDELAKRGHAPARPAGEESNE